MVEIIPAPDHVVALRVAGTLQAEDYDSMMIPLIEDKLQEHAQIGVYIDLEQFEDMTGQAIQRDLKYGIDKFGELHRFRRIAVVSNKQWVKAVMEFAAALLPRIELQVFSSSEKDAALAWASLTSDSTDTSRLQ